MKKVRTGFRYKVWLILFQTNQTTFSMGMSGTKNYSKHKWICLRLALGTTTRLATQLDFTNSQVPI